MDRSPNRPRTEKTVGDTRVRDLIADGLRWQVREMPAPAFDRRGGSHLMFDGEVIMRRVRVFPANWYDLTDDELYALTERIQVEESVREEM
jgi:hypothetical protein